MSSEEKEDEVMLIERVKTQREKQLESQGWQFITNFEPHVEEYKRVPEYYRTIFPEVYIDDQAFTNDGKLLHDAKAVYVKGERKTEASYFSEWLAQERRDE